MKNLLLKKLKSWSITKIWSRRWHARERRKKDNLECLQATVLNVWKLLKLTRIWVKKFWRPLNYAESLRLRKRKFFRFTNLILMFWTILTKESRKFKVSTTKPTKPTRLLTISTRDLTRSSLISSLSKSKKVLWRRKTCSSRTCLSSTSTV